MTTLSLMSSDDWLEIVTTCAWLKEKGYSHEFIAGYVYRELGEPEDFKSMQDSIKQAYQ